MITNLDGALETWREWGLELRERPRLVGPVPGGLTNRNYRLNAPGAGHDLLLRIHHPRSESLGIDRSAERIILTHVGEHGIGRPALYWDPSARFTVFEWMEGRAWTPADFARADQRARLWPLLERLAKVSPDLPRRRYHAYLCHYWQQLDRGDVVEHELRESWQAFEPRLRAFDRSDWPARLVHHDLVPANVLDTGGRLLLIDWEYAALGHPDIDVWSVAPERCGEPFVAELMGWVNALWERLATR